MATYMRLIPNKLYNELQAKGLLKEDFYFEKKLNKTDQIISHLTSALQEEGRIVLSAIKHFIDWNEKGQVVCNGKPIEKSNLSDLLTLYILQCDNRFKLSGWNEFNTAVSKANLTRPSEKEEKELQTGGSSSPTKCNWISFENFVKSK